MNATPNPDPDALAWLDAHLAADDASLIEALPDTAIHAELRELGLDPARLKVPAPTLRPMRQDRAAAPRARPFRPSWLYAAASVLLIVAASVVVLRETPDVPALPPPATETPQAKTPDAAPGAGKTAVGPAPAVEPAPEAAGPRGTGRAVVKPAPPSFPPSAARTRGEGLVQEAPPVAEQSASMAAPPPPPPVLARQAAAPKNAYAPMRADASPALTLDEALLKAEAAPESPADTTALENASLRAAISVLTRAYEADTPAEDAEAPRRKRLAAALAQAYTALGDAEQARRWTFRAKQP